MNRRGFLKGLGGVILGLSAISILPQATTYKRTWKWKKAADSGLIVPNPEWIEAPYEYRFVMDSRAFQSFHFGPTPSKAIIADRNKPLQLAENEVIISDTMPIRLRFNKETQEYEKVYPYIKFLGT